MEPITLGFDESLYRALFEQTNDAVFIIGLDLRYIAVNSQAAEMLGYEIDELIGMSVSDIVALETHSEGATSSSFETIGAGQPIYERTFRRKDGSTFPVEISTSFVYDESLIPRHIQSIVRDITERKQFEWNLQLSEERYRKIVEALPDLVIRINRYGKIIDFVANKEHPLYIHPLQAQSKMIEEIWPETLAQKLMEQMALAVQSGTQIVYETRFPNDENTYEIRIDKISQSESFIIIRDVSERAKLEQLKTDFINRASHELRTPLTTAILMTDLIQEGGSKEEIEEFWKILVNELERQKQLIDRLLTAGRLESDMLMIEASPLELIPIIENSISAVKAIAIKNNIDIDLEAPEYLPKVIGENIALQQIFINLLNNAVKFSPDGSQVQVKVEIAENWAYIQFTDKGMGIPEEDIPNLFERFFRAKNVTLAEIPGTGVGLYLVKSIVSKLGGDINVKSEIGKGTVFTVKLRTAQTNI